MTRSKLSDRFDHYHKNHFISPSFQKENLGHSANSIASAINSVSHEPDEGLSTEFDIRSMQKNSMHCNILFQITVKISCEISSKSYFLEVRGILLKA